MHTGSMTDAVDSRSREQGVGDQRWRTNIRYTPAMFRDQRVASSLHSADGYLVSQTFWSSSGTGVAT